MHFGLPVGIKSHSILDNVFWEVHFRFLMHFSLPVDITSHSVLYNFSEKCSSVCRWHNTSLYSQQISGTKFSSFWISFPSHFPPPFYAKKGGCLRSRHGDEVRASVCEQNVLASVSHLFVGRLSPRLGHRSAPVGLKVMQKKKSLWMHKSDLAWPCIWVTVTQNLKLQLAWYSQLFVSRCSPDLGHSSMFKCLMCSHECLQWWSWWWSTGWDTVI